MRQYFHFRRHHDEIISFVPIRDPFYKYPCRVREKNRFEKLNKDEVGVYKMLDTLKTVKKFKQMYNLVSILGSEYINYHKFDYGPIFSTFGNNVVEGWRLRVGGRTYFGHNDKWRVQGYTAYGFKDNKFKYIDDFINNFINFVKLCMML